MITLYVWTTITLLSIVELGRRVTAVLTDKIPRCKNSLCHVVNAGLGDLSTADSGLELRAPKNGLPVVIGTWHGHIESGSGADVGCVLCLMIHLSKLKSE